MTTIEIPNLTHITCGHTWTPRKMAVPKRCPRCQEILGDDVVFSASPGSTVDVSPVGTANPHEAAVLADVLAILRSLDPVAVGMILSTIGAWKKARK